MGKRGTKSKNSLKISVIEPTAKTRLIPPKTLNPKQKRIWNKVVDSYPSSHFLESDAFQLEAYCCAVEMRDKAQDHIRRFGQVTKVEVGFKTNPSVQIIIQANSTINQLATKLRICVSSRKKQHQTQVDKPIVKSKRPMFKG